MPSDRDHVLAIRIDLGQTLSQTPNEGIDGLLGDTLLVCVGPHQIHDFVAAAYLAYWVVEQLQESVLGWRKGWTQLRRADPYAPRLSIQAQPAHRLDPFQRQGCVHPDEAESVTQCYLDLIVVFEFYGSRDRLAIQVGAVLTAQVPQEMASSVEEYLGVLPRDLALGQHNIASLVPTAPSDDHRWLVNGDLAACQWSFLYDQERLLGRALHADLVSFS
jgi:hypothetical protein